MTLSIEDQALFDHARNSLPRWLTTSGATVLEWLFYDTEIFSAVRDQLQDWVDVTYLSNASGIELDQHAIDRGTSRRASESDSTLRARLRTPVDAVTEPALLTGINAILVSQFGSMSYPHPQIVNLRRDRAHMQYPGSSLAFFDRGYRMSFNTRPSAYIVILPFGTTTETAAAVLEYLRQFGPGGFFRIVEVRQVP